MSTATDNDDAPPSQQRRSSRARVQTTTIFERGEWGDAAQTFLKSKKAQKEADERGSDDGGDSHYDSGDGDGDGDGGDSDGKESCDLNHQDIPTQKDREFVDDSDCDDDGDDKFQASDSSSLSSSSDDDDVMSSSDEEVDGNAGTAVEKRARTVEWREKCIVELDKDIKRMRDRILSILKQKKPVPKAAVDALQYKILERERAHSANQWCQRKGKRARDDAT